MKEQEVIRVLGSAISNITKNRNAFAIRELQELKSRFEKIVKQQAEKKVKKKIVEEYIAPEDMPDEPN
ncbi:hypothetical protein NIES267_68830 [Calothrix parasitica NIES-267]|uniref:Uncharacterized protein n=1 Tax=Calothrix parasitica NIES-267 TaxID=1973488 RepID=A0A1Z4M1S7_9CYAN|nr:hypothetical protein NIES267_68830 [Calothrix parasitica NIES-267]